MSSTTRSPDIAQFWKCARFLIMTTHSLYDFFLYYTIPLLLIRNNCTFWFIYLTKCTKSIKINSLERYHVFMPHLYIFLEQCGSLTVIPKTNITLLCAQVSRVYMFKHWSHSWMFAETRHPQMSPQLWGCLIDILSLCSQRGFDIRAGTGQLLMNSHISAIL